MVWRSLRHVFLAQAVFIWIYIVWPFLRDFSQASFRFIGRYFSDQTRRAEEAAMANAEALEATNWQRFQDQLYRSADERWEARSGWMPHTERERHLYTLHLKADAPDWAIRNAYKRLVKRFSPGRYDYSVNTNEQRAAAAERLAEVVEAYDWLIANA